MEDEEIIIPSINGVSLYFTHEGTDKKTLLLDGYNLIEFIQSNLLKSYDIKAMRAFIYVIGKTQKDFDILSNVVNKNMTKWDVNLKNLSHKGNELKLKFDPISAKVLGEIL